MLAAPAAADAFDLEQFMQMRSRVVSSSARFVEEKHLAVLAAPLVTRGTLRYEAPDYLAKSYDSRELESYEVRADELRIDAPDGTSRVVALRTQPLVSAFIAAFRATLAGDLDTLEASYDVSLVGDAASWRLTLEPVRGGPGSGLGDYITSVRMTGTQATIRSVEIREPNGDYSVMTLETPGG